jgi:RimJ/RimL family protein N-acetyltransferase
MIASRTRWLPPYEETRLDMGNLVLLPWHDADAAAIAAAYQADPEIPRRTGFSYRMTTAEAAAYIAERREAWKASANAAFGIFGESGRLLGSISLLAIDWDNRTAEVGFWLAREARGSGIATRALRQLARWAAELGLVRLTGTVELTNSASKRVLERAHFAHAGIARRNRVLHGQPIDEDLYVLELGVPRAGNRER